jgi:hypothetical protein
MASIRDKLLCRAVWMWVGEGESVGVDLDKANNHPDRHPHSQMQVCQCFLWLVLVYKSLTESFSSLPVEQIKTLWKQRYFTVKKE